MKQTVMIKKKNNTGTSCIVISSMDLELIIGSAAFRNPQDFTSFRKANITFTD